MTEATGYKCKWAAARTMLSSLLGILLVFLLWSWLVALAFIVSVYEYYIDYHH